MDNDGERRKSRRLFYIYFIDDTACAATPEWSDEKNSICPHILPQYGIAPRRDNRRRCHIEKPCNAVHCRSRKIPQYGII